MKGPGLFSMIQYALGLSMAAPMCVVGLDYATTGQPLPAIGFFVLGMVALFAPTWLVRRIGGPRAWIKRRLGR